MVFDIKPTTADLVVASAIAKHTSPIPEEIASILTLAADERTLLALVGVAWLGSRRRPEATRVIYNHAMVVSIAASVLPHLLKLMFNQTRPDRLDGPGSSERNTRFRATRGCFPVGTRVAHGSPRIARQFIATEAADSNPKRVSWAFAE